MNRFELLQKLRNTDEVLLIELLQLTSDKIVDAFLDEIEENEDYLYDQLKETQLGIEEEQDR